MILVGTDWVHYTTSLSVSLFFASPTPVYPPEEWLTFYRLDRHNRHPRPGVLRLPLLDAYQTMAHMCLHAVDYGFELDRVVISGECFSRSDMLLVSVQLVRLPGGSADRIPYPHRSYRRKELVYVSSLPLLSTVQTDANSSSSSTSTRPLWSSHSIRCYDYDFDGVASLPTEDIRSASFWYVFQFYLAFLVLRSSSFLSFITP